MNIGNEKAEKLVTIARLYYEQNKTQQEIAEQLGISRPLVSRYLSEAREFGIVYIEVRSPLAGNSLLLNQLRNIYQLKGGVVVPDGGSNLATNEAVAKAALSYLGDLQGAHIGLGWGSIIGTMISVLEERETENSFSGTVCPLVGNSGVFNRNYHSNEIVRAFAQKTGAQPFYWHAPAFVESRQELTQLKELDNYRAVSRAWEQLNVALVNIGNYPSTPDFATAARYGRQLTDEGAVGRLLCYYFNLAGTIIRNENDCTMQIPLDQLSRAQQVVGICAGNVKPKALLGALQTGLFTHLIAPEPLILDALEQR